MSLMDQPVNGTHRDHVLREDAIPTAERLAGGEKKTTCLLSMRHESERHRGLVFAGFDFAGVHVAVGAN